MLSILPLSPVFFKCLQVQACNWKEKFLLTLLSFSIVCTFTSWFNYLTWGVWLIQVDWNPISLSWCHTKLCNRHYRLCNDYYIHWGHLQHSYSHHLSSNTGIACELALLFSLPSFPFFPRNAWYSGYLWVCLLAYLWLLLTLNSTKIFVKWKWNCEKATNCFTRMSRNLARQTSRDLHSYYFAMVLTAGFYCDSWAHNVRKIRVVKYIVVYGHIKAADQKYCHKQ